MNEYQVYKQLTEALNDIHILPDCLSELFVLIKESGSEKSFFKKLVHHLHGLLIISPNDTKLPSHLEKLKNAKNLYSLHVQGKGYNIRILYTYYKAKIILVLAFYERENKKRSDYTPYIPAALERIKKI